MHTTRRSRTYLSISLDKALSKASRTFFHPISSHCARVKLFVSSKAATGVLVVALLYLSSLSAHAQTPSYPQNVVLVKFRANSPLFTKWEYNKRQGTITEWQGILHTHTSEALFDDEREESVILG